MHLVPLALLLAAAPAASRSFTVDPAASAVTFHIVHKLHRVAGHTSALEGKAVLEADGKLLAMVRAPVATFDSGDRNRDTHMLETVEASRFPFVVFKALGQLDASVVPASGGTPVSVPVTLAGELDFHGVKEPISVPITVELRPDGTARATGAFEFGLERHRIERPSLLFVKIDDACRVEVDLALREAR
jgi:polyisoprenoid-binding protein YceI